MQKSADLSQGESGPDPDDFHTLEIPLHLGQFPCAIKCLRRCDQWYLREVANILTNKRPVKHNVLGEDNKLGLHPRPHTEQLSDAQLDGWMLHGWEERGKGRGR